MSSKRRSQAPISIHCDEPDRTQKSGFTNSKDDEATKYLDTRADSPIDSIERETSTTYGLGSKEHDYDFLTPLHRNINATSLSSLPNSALASDDESRYSPTKGPRPALRSPSIRRTQRGSLKSERLSPHRTFRASSPRKSANVRSSPRPRTRERQEEKDTTYFPLVLLHVTILSVALPWSQKTLKETLPKDVRDSLALLRSRLSSVLLQRGLLIPHPQDEFDILEDRVLEALDLVSCAGTICRDFGVSGDYEDFISQSDLREEPSDVCQTCGDENCFSKKSEMRWDVKVYAANGLMGAGAWAAAWSEMERVDVEILPHIPHELRCMLDEVHAETYLAEVEEARVRQTYMPETSSSCEQSNDVPGASLPHGKAPTFSSHRRTTPSPAPKSKTQSMGQQKPAVGAKLYKLPSAYRSKDVPLRVLLANYIYLLAQDRRNIAILFLFITVIFSTLQGLGALRPKPQLDSQVDVGSMDGGLMLLMSSDLIASSSAVDATVQTSQVSEVGHRVLDVRPIDVQQHMPHLLDPRQEDTIEWPDPGAKDKTEQEVTGPEHAGLTRQSSATFEAVEDVVGVRSCRPVPSVLNTTCAIDANARE